MCSCLERIRGRGNGLGSRIMKSETENIGLLERAILEEARAEAGQIQDEARVKADEIRRRAQEQAQVEREAILARAGQDAERLRRQAVATAQLKARTLHLEHREKLLDQVFEAARAKLPAIRDRRDYDQIAVRLLREALTQLKVSEAQIRADETTQKVLKDGALKKVSKDAEARLTLGKALTDGNGLIVDASDGHLHYDNTFETRLSRLQSALRSAVYQVLMGEKL